MVALVTRTTYGNHGRPATQTLPSGKVVAYPWTAAKLTGMTLDGQPLVSGIQEIPFGPVKQWTFANGEQVQRTFDRSGRMTGHSLGTISYDTADRITGLTQGGLSQLTGSKTYGYDALDRLTSYLGAGYGIGYSYDANGNRTQQTAQAGTTNYVIDPLSNRVNSLSVNGITQSFSYDANGSLTGDGLHAYGYDATGRLANVDGSTAYGYNGLGQRVSKAASGSGTLFAYDAAGRMLGEYDAGTGNTIQETIWMGDTPVAVIKASGTYYVHADHLNTPRQIDDANGDPVWAWDTITFGASTPDEDPLATGTLFVYNLRHPGQYFDAESGLLQNHYWDYSPGLGRYTQVDPLGLYGGSLSPYLYANQSPLSFIDPRGLEVLSLPTWAMPAVRYAAGSAATAAVAVLSMPGDTKQRRLYATYTRTHPKTGKTYCGRTSGFVGDDPNALVKARGLQQTPLNDEGYDPPVLDQYSESYDAIRGREQQLIDFHGGARSVGGTTRNAINGVGDYNPNGLVYGPAARLEFGPLPDNSPERFRIWNFGSLE